LYSFLMSDFQDDPAEGFSGFKRSLRFTGLGKGIDSIDNRLQLAGIDHLCGIV